MEMDLSAYEALFKMHYAPLARAAFRIVNDPDVAEDLVQDIFFKLWEKKDTLNITISLKSYLYQSTINHSLNYLKKVKRSDARESFFETSRSEESNNSESYVALKETARQVDLAVNSLPDACRTVFILSRYEHLSYREIAQQLEISVKTVENHMVKALKHLRKCLGALIFFIFLSLL